MGKKGTRDRQASMWVATADLPKSAGHPFYARLNRVLDDAGFDTFVEAQCAPFYADGIGRPSLAPGRYVRLLLLGYFEGLELGAGHRVARGRFAEQPAVPGLCAARGAAGPFDPVAHAPADRRRDAPSGVHVGGCSGWRTPTWWRGTRLGSTRRRSKPTRRCEASCVGHGRRVQGVADAARGGVGHRDAHAGRAGPVRHGSGRRRGRTRTGPTRTIPMRRSRR